MGIVLSRFRKKRTTLEVLHELDKKIKAIEQYGQTTEQRHKKIVGTLVIYSVVLYIMTAFIFYFYFFPASLYDQIFYITPLLIFPILILFTKKMVSWYYKRKISYNQEKLSKMEEEKTKILDEVTETETYKKAKEILLTFAPDRLRMTPLTPQPAIKVPPASETPRQVNTPQVVASPLPGAGNLRRRVLTGPNQPPLMQTGMPTNAGAIPVGVAPIQSPQPSTPLPAGAKMINTSSVGYRTPLPRPILPSPRSYLDRLVDYLVSDGPSNRYALICRQCETHNGMALKEEFDYFGFRCYYCNFLNSARKQKPSAPKLKENVSPESSTSDTPKEAPVTKNLESIKFVDLEPSSQSDTDSDIEVVERPLDVSENPERIAEQCSNTNGEAAEDSEVKEAKEKEEKDEPMEIDEDAAK